MAALRDFAIATLVVAAGCSGDAAMVSTSYARATYCPDARVHATALRELALWRARPDDPAPAGRGVPPADIAADPERLALWRADRAGTDRAWEGPQPPRDARRDDALYAVDGCGAPELYTCRSGPPHHRSCERIDEAGDTGTYLACRDGTAVRFRGGAFSCSGAAASDAHGDGCARTRLGALGLCKLLAHE